MLLFTAAVLAGLVLLVWGADRFVAGAAATARNLGVPPLVVGLTVVGVGTSAPEILVSATAAASGSPAMAIGNAVGSNIANIGLVAGSTALVVPLAVRSATLRREFPLMFAVVGLAALVLGHGALSRTGGAILVVGFALLLVTMVALARDARRGDPLGREFAGGIPTDTATPRALGWVAIGLLALLGGSRAIVWGASSIAAAFGVSELVIGLTIVAVGTSLPELAASLASALKGEHDIAIGNVLGSNMFNLLPVLALPGLIAPGPLEPEVMQRDFPAMVGMSAAFFAVAFGFGGAGIVRRWEGALLLAAFGGYQVLLYQTGVTPA